MTMLLSDASDYLTYDTEKLDTDKMLWIVNGVTGLSEMYECDINNAVSVYGSELDNLKKCGGFFSSFQSVMVALTNNEDAVRACNMLEGVAPTVKIYVPKGGVLSPDIVQEMYDGGEAAIKRLVITSVEVSPGGLLNLADVKRVDRSKIKTVMSGFESLDRMIGGFSEGELSIWTGKRGSGKSTLLCQILIDAVNQGNKVCAYSGELSSVRFKEWALLQAAGAGYITEKTDSVSGQKYFIVPYDIQDMIDEWWNEKFFLYDNKISQSGDEESILNVFDYAVRRHGCCVFLVDNLMTARFSTSSDKDYFRAQSKFTGRLVEFAKKNNVHVHLVAHPRKTDNNRNSKLSADDISGSGDITNRADNVFFVNRLDEEMVEEKGYTTTVEILKNRCFGKTGKFAFSFDSTCRRFNTVGAKEKRYGWEFIGREMF